MSKKTETKSADLSNLSNGVQMVQSNTVDETSNENLNPRVPKGGILVKVPVVLAELKVQIDLESLIKLSEPALDIKRIKKNVFITQCKVIPFTNKLFLGGFVRKNIEYSAVSHSGSNGVSGCIKHDTVDVQFTTATEVDFLTKPKFNKNFATDSSTLNCKCGCGSQVDGKNMDEDNLISVEHFNEPIFCEIISAFIQEVDIHEPDSNLPQVSMKNEKLFQTLKEKMVVFVTLKLLQKQQVIVEKKGEPYPRPCDSDPISTDPTYGKNMHSFKAKEDEDDDDDDDEYED